MKVYKVCTDNFADYLRTKKDANNVFNYLKKHGETYIRMYKQIWSDDETDEPEEEFIKGFGELNYFLTLKNKDMKETFKQAGYTYVKYLGNKEHLLRNEDKIPEIWFANKNHASYGLVYKNTHLEFAHHCHREELLKLTKYEN